MERINMKNLNEVKSALEYGLNAMAPDEWQEEIIEILKSMSSTSEPQIPSDRVYWLTILYEMFGKLKQAGL